MFASLFKLARPTQWLKNGLLLAALVFAGEIAHRSQILYALLGMGVFCLLSSAVYTLNDLIDLEKDKSHPAKKNRPLAAGAISRQTAVLFMLAIGLSGVAGAWLLGQQFFLISCAFVALNILYSLILKNIVIVDAMSIALSFVVRAYAGAIVIDVPASKWLLINAFLLALFLSFGKRRHELVMLESGATAHRTILDKYSPYFLDQLISVVTPSVVVVYMLYSFAPEVSNKLGTENLFLTIPFVVYGIFRYLYLIHQEEKGGSPTEVFLNDKPILINVILWLLTVILILYKL